MSQHDHPNAPPPRSLAQAISGVSSQQPPPLKPGDTIGVFAPSSWVTPEDIEQSRQFIESRGYKVYVHPQTFARHHQFAGTSAQRRDALYTLWNDPEIGCIWAAGGGNGCLHLLEQLDYSRLATPKALIGFSDVTALLNALYAHHGHVCYHGPTFGRLYRSAQADQALAILAGDYSHALNIRADSTPPAEITPIILREGEAMGHLIGGNLSLFHYLPHTLPGTFWQAGILFIEDCNEELSRIDRMMLQLKRLGVLQTISGLVCGHFAPLLDTGKPYDMSMADIVLSHLEGIDIPIVLNAPFGHASALYTFPIGKKARLFAQKNKAELRFE